MSNIKTLSYRIIFTLFSLLLSLGAQAQFLPIEKINKAPVTYDVVFHWGMIWKTAAQATHTMHINGSHLSSQLTAKTLSWAETFHSTRDTLTSTMSYPQLRPISYRERVHEGKDNKISTTSIDYRWSGSKVLAMSKIARPDKPRTSAVYNATGDTYDLGSLFVLLRRLDVNSLRSGWSYTANIFSSKQEKFTLTYVGKETIEMRDKQNSKHETVHLHLTYSQGSTKNSSDGMDIYMSTDGSNLPLLVRAKIAVGEIRCYCKR